VVGSVVGGAVVGGAVVGGAVVGGVLLDVQCDTTNWGLPWPVGVNVALADTTVAPRSVVMSHLDVFPVWLFSAKFTTVVPSENTALMVAPAFV